MSERDQIRSFILENFLLSTEAPEIGDATSLSESGLIDSSGMLEIVMYLEETWDIRVADEEMLRENFDTVDGIVAFLDRKRAAAIR
jgi:acyl carrier protein